MQFRKLLIGCALAAFAATPAWGQGGTLTVGLKAEPSSIDPHYHNLGPNNSMAAHYFSRLVEQDDKLRLLPGLAVSWKPINDTTWEFKLREGVKFHDGSDFNADDVMFTFERAPNVPNSPSSFATYLKGKTFTKVDDYTIHISTERPYPLMPVDMAATPIISSDVGADVTTADFNSGKAAMGTGPYRFVEWVPGDRLVIERNEDYFDAKPEWDKIVFKPIKSGPARVAALLAGDVDFIDNVPPIDIPRLKGDENVQLSQGVSSRVIYLHMDQFREDSPFVKANGGGDIKNPLLDVRVRKAISKAIDRDAIVDRVMEGVAIKAGQLLPEGFFGVTPNLSPEPYDPEGAKAAVGRGRLSGRVRANHPRTQRPLHQRRQDLRGGRPNVDPHRHQDGGRDYAQGGLFPAREPRRTGQVAGVQLHPRRLGLGHRRVVLAAAFAAPHL